MVIPGKSTRPTQAAPDEVLARLPQPLQVLLSDNGREFEVRLARSLERHDIQRRDTDPRTPQMNAHAERFNRTLQESFVDDHKDLLFTDLALFNRKPTEWLVFTNTERPPQGLDQPSPLSFLLHHQPECQRWWTYTGS